MSYVQGTVVIVDLWLKDPDTDAPSDPNDVIVTVLPPTQPSHELTQTIGNVLRVEPGHYRFWLDTSTEPGLWRYQIDATGAEAVRKQRKVRVTPAWA